jgi:osmotically-inducible protein OsmY
MSMPDVTLTPVRKFSAKARKTASDAQTSAIKTASALAATGRFAATGARAAAVVVGIWWSAALNREATRRPRRAAKAPRIAAALAGAGAQFLLDPANGKRRRRMLKDRGSSAIRGLVRQGGHRAQYLAGVAKGKAHEATATPTPPADDNTLSDRVRTEVFRRADAPKGAVNVSVVDGVVHLHGELSSLEDIERLISDARGVPGVRGVESSLHLGGVGAPSAAG